MNAKKSRSNKKQINMLVNFMSTHNNLATGDFTGPLGAKRANTQWQILKDILKEYGPDRTIDQWKQTWKDLKKGARTENAAASRESSNTGNSGTVPTMSEVGAKVLNIIGYESSTGIGPEESSIGQANQEIIEESMVEHDTQDAFIRLQQENNAYLQSIDERLKERNNLLHEQNQLLRAQNAHLAHKNKLKRMKRFSQRFTF